MTVLVQRRPGSLRLVRQHDHAMMAGRLASEWREPPVGPVPWPTVVAISLHDVVWSHEDRWPRLDDASGMPWDFASIPASHKADLVERGLERLRAASPELAGPVEAHHRALALGPPSGADPVLTRVRFFDLLSLRICLTPPGVLDPPDWLLRTGRVEPDGLELPTLRWAAPDTATLAPFPFRDPLELHLACRDLPSGPFPDPAALRRAWDTAPERRWTVRLIP